MAIGKNVKGITIEFNADTTKLGAAMKQVNAQAKGVDAQLKAVNKALKFNPGNTELLAQKQTLLKQKIGQTKDQLDLLRQAQAKLDDDPAVDKTSQDYMELRREIITTESKLKHFESELKKAENYKFEKLGKSIQDVGGKMKKVGDGMSKYVTLPIVGAGAASIKAFNEVKDGLNIVAQKTGAAGEELTKMQDSARNLAKGIPTDFETAGTAIGEVNTRFGLTGDALETLSGKFVQFAKVNDTDVNSSIDETQKALSAFGLGADDAGHVLDVLTRVGQNTGASMENLTSGLIQNGTAFQELGLNIDQAATLMGQMEKSGANSETVMQGLRKALKNAAEDGIPLDEALSNLQDTILNGTGSMDGLTAAYDLFGKSGDQIYGAVKNGTLDFNDLAGAAENMDGTLQKTFEETLTPAEKFQTTLNTMKDAGYEIGSTIMEMVAPALEIITQKVQKLAEWWHNLSPEMQKTIIKVAGIVAAVGPLLSILGRVTTGVGAIVKFMPTILGLGPKLVGMFGMIGKAFTAMKTLLLGNPWILAAAAAIAAIILIVNNWDKIKEFFIQLWAKVKEIFGAAWEAIKTAVLAAWNAIKEAAVAVWDAIKAFFVAWISFYINLYKKAFEIIKTVVLAVWNGIKTAAVAVWNAIKTFFVNWFKFYINIYKTAFNAIKTVVLTVWNAIKKAATTIWNGIKTAVTAPVKAIKSFLSNAWTAIRDKAKSGFQKVKDAITAPIQKAKDIIKGIIDKIKGFFDFDFKLPDIKLPHISVSPPGWNIGDIFDGVIPSLGIDWYAKGGIFERPTVAGLGDVRGGEAALPLEPFWKRMDAIVSAVESGGGGDEITINVYTTPGMDVQAVAQAVEKRLAMAQKQRQEVWR